MATHSQNKRRTKKSTQKQNKSVQIFQDDKKLELVVAALLITGKLKVDSIQLYTDASLFVSLVGKFKSSNDDSINKLVDFMNENGDITINDIMAALKKKG